MIRWRDAARQRLQILRAPGCRPGSIRIDVILDALALDRRAVDVEDALAHLDAVAGQADHALDEVGLGLARRAEHDDLAACRRAFQIRPSNGIRPQGNENLE